MSESYCYCDLAPGQGEMALHIRRITPHSPYGGVGYSLCHREMSCDFVMDVEPLMPDEQVCPECRAEYLEATR